MSDHLCEDLTDEIFPRLPVKSLLRFRSLSKYWFARIASPDFIRTHKLRSVDTPLKLLIKHNSFDLDFWFYRTGVIYTLFSENRLSLDYQPAQSMNVAEVDLPSRAFDIVGSCNGILCVVDKKRFLPYGTLQLGATIPVPLYYIGRGCHLALGFGVDPITDDYKIVMIPYSQTDPLVYSMKADTWSLINSPTMPLKNVMSRACLVDETLYWVVECKQTGICIMTFNLSTNVCGTIEFHGPRCETRKLMVVKDSLAVLYTTSSNDWIWVGRERNNSACWSKVVRSLTWSFDQRVGRVLELTDGDFLLHKYELGLTVYNPERGESPFPSSYISDIIDMETYAESLALLDRGVVCKGYQQSCNVEAKTNGRKRKIFLVLVLDSSV